MMLWILVIFSFLGSGSSLPTGGDGKIAGGWPTTIAEAPHQVAMLLDYWSIGTYNIACGGSIISRNIILSVAHCTNGTVASQWRIRAGATLHNSGGQLVGVTTIVQHPGYDSRLDNDVSLLYTATRLKLGPDVASIWIPPQGYQLAEGETGTITGWGVRVVAGSATIQLQMASVRVANQAGCAAAYAPHALVTERMLCASGEAGAGACEGDSGAPLVVSGVLQGVASWGGGCGDADYPGVYARLASFSDWIGTKVAHSDGGGDGHSTL